MTHAKDERAAISDLLIRLGPDQPTLCEGWTTSDLVAHLVTRERRIDAAAGIAVKFMAPYTRSVMDGVKAKGFSEAVELFRQGPPKWTPYGLAPGLDSAVNTIEFFVHHEDLRRAQPDWEPRELTPEYEQLLFKRLKTGARFLFRKSPVGVILRLPDGELVGAKKAEPHVIVTGRPQELLLLAFGRTGVADVAYEGDPETVRQLKAAPLGS